MSEQSHTSSGIEIPAEAREWQDGYGNRDNNEVHPHGGIVRDEQVSRVLSIIEECYDPTEAERPDEMPGQAKDLELVQQLRRMEGTETFRQAMDEGDLDTLTHFTGNTSKRADVSGLQAIGKLEQLVAGPAPVIVILGEMGTGKTDFAGLLGQLWERQQDEEVLIGSNIQSLEERTEWEGGDGWIADYGSLVEWIEQDGDPLWHDQTPKLFIGDEFSSAASGRGKEGYETAMKMAPLVYKIRKYNGALIYIAHGPKSIHPILWRVGTIVKKTSQKKAVVADRLDGTRLADVHFRVQGVPPTDWHFDTTEASPWSWQRYDDEDEDKLESVDELVDAFAMWTIVEGREREDSVAYRELANWTPWDASTCKRRYDRYVEDNQYQEQVQRIDSLIA